MSQELEPTPETPGGATAPVRPAAPVGRRPLGCWGIGAITCGSLFLVFAVFGVVVVWLARPHLGQWMGTFQEMAQCMQQLQSIGGAIDRYRTGHGSYPPNLDALYPQYISQRSRLHCPADPSQSSQVSYQYRRPPATASDDADPEAVLVTCDHHRITLAGRTSVYMLELLRSGQVRQKTAILSPGGGR